MSMRISKVRITDYRPPGAGSRPPLERPVAATRGGSMTGLDHLAANQRKDAAEHEKAVECYDEETLTAIAMDLRQRRAWDRKNHEHRWIMNRLAAVLRVLDRKGALA